MQFVDREINFFGGGKHFGQADIFDVGIGAETRIAEAHGDAPGDAAAKSAGVKIRDD